MIPRAKPTAAPTSRQAASGRPAAYMSRMTIAEETPTKPITKPSERSMPPVMITKVSPAASKT
jgi:hypothetical protein